MLWSLCDAYIKVKEITKKDHFIKKMVKVRHLSLKKIQHLFALSSSSINDQEYIYIYNEVSFTF